jgi:predicted nucleic-acid-binding Zn-ribbon protein
MKATGSCPKCQSTALWYVEDVAANEETGTSQQQPTFRLAVTGRGTLGRGGNLEAYACQQCGCVELYLKERLTADGQHVRELRRPDAPPYRGRG